MIHWPEESDHLGPAHSAGRAEVVSATSTARERHGPVMMDEDSFREHVCACLKAIADAVVDLARAQEALALALSKQGRQGTLRIKIDAPTSKLRGKRRRLKRSVANANGGAQ